jgi:hypothetical protein
MTLVNEEEENGAFIAEVKATGSSSIKTKGNMQNYPGNSNTGKVEETEKPKVEPVTTAKQKKKTLGQKVSETFTGDDMQSVGSFVLFDVIIPAAKDLVVDALTQGIQRRFYGAGFRPRGGGGGIGGGPKISYNNMYRNGPSNSTISGTATPSPALSRRGRSTHDFSEIIIENRGDAEEIIERLRDLIDNYNVASVKDFYDLVSVTADYTDNKWGWNNLNSASVMRARGGGYVIDLPPTKEIE